MIGERWPRTSCAVLACLPNLADAGQPSETSSSSENFLPSIAPGGSGSLPVWLETFHSFSVIHAVMVLTAAAVCAWLCARARGGHRQSNAALIARRWGFFIFAWQSLDVVYHAAKLDWAVSLPLHMCDVVAWIAGFALITENRRLQTLLYFWGIGLSSQAFITPTVHVGPAHLKFWLFWVGHSNIVLVGLFEVIARGYRPGWRDLRFASIMTLAYGAVVTPVNILLHVNYGYIGDSRPDASTVVDIMGPWPGRIWWVALIVYSSFLVVTLIWPRNWPKRWPKDWSGWRQPDLATTPPSNSRPD